MYKYTLKIEGEYFKEYVYLTQDNKNRYSGNTQLGILLREGDIVDIITTQEPERFEYPRSIGEVVMILLKIDKLKGKSIEIIPIKED